ncbi:hypothetical protein [Acidihalobacter ferrooxydans]|nr:hypothetical protein [Acidihalobacter ferrooxydans]
MTVEINNPRLSGVALNLVMRDEDSIKWTPDFGQQFKLSGKDLRIEE